MRVTGKIFDRNVGKGEGNVRINRTVGKDKT